MANRLHLVSVPLLNSGVTFNEDELNARVQLLLKEIKILIPKIISFNSVDLSYEMIVDEQHLVLNIFLVELAQFSINFLDKIPMAQIKELILKELNWLPIKLNLIALQSQSINSSELTFQGKSEDQHLKKLMRKRQKSILKFLLEDEDFSFSFPEMVPYIIDERVRTIEFKIEYIHARHLKIKLVSDSLSGKKINKGLHLMVRNKIHDDAFYKLCTEALRPHRILMCKAISYIDCITNEILTFEAI